MGKVTDDLHSGFSGKVGNLIFYQVNGQTLIRTKPGQRTGNTTPLQTYHQEAFALVQQFLSPLKKELAIGFDAYRKGAKRGIDRAKSLMLKNAIYPLDGAPVLQPEKMLVSSGDLTGVRDAFLTDLGSGKFTIEWTSNSWDGSARDSDMTFVVVYDTVHQRVFSVQGLRYRKDGYQEIQLPWLTFDSGTEVPGVYVFFSFYSERSEKSMFSDSICLGKITGGGG
ncbi:DUF6266 family protein [Algoriphagus sp. D3-2-R+10]|uniref:DUF6266 family protein n=1 Tax=Algoriphagus aurantiacus TaxID=3103948 RepID=UPI002B386036|nr:DUF6266 family protein [Algoriphagus sp. D3-2-R+10]MEB2778487.1 DUF6266 family protein [Algoriphagus sp. D3-2-R+10]